LTDQFEDGSTTPTLESHKYFTVVVHHSAEVDPIGVIQSEAAAIEVIDPKKSAPPLGMAIPF
jgi:hypothetical protein